jgi:argininosuccinate synthase
VFSSYRSDTNQLVQAIAHGSSRNDQIRFDLIFQAIAPEIEIIIPLET